MNNFDDEEINKHREWNVNIDKLKRWLFVSLFVDSFQTFIELKAKFFCFLSFDCFFVEMRNSWRFNFSVLNEWKKTFYDPYEVFFLKNSSDIRVCFCCERIET